MKKSRLNIFKSTSMVISILGVIMIIATIIVAVYIGFNFVSDGLTGGVSSSNQYDELNTLRANYSDLEGQFNTTKMVVYASDDDALQQKFAEAELELVRAKNSLDDVSSALSMGKSSDDINSRLEKAKSDLNVAHQAYNEIQQRL